jgi:hypothetical protein
MRFAAASVLAALLLFAYTRTANRDPRRILDLGLGCMVFTALALGLTFHSGPILPTVSVAPQISCIGSPGSIPVSPAASKPAGRHGSRSATIGSMRVVRTASSSVGHETGRDQGERGD